MKIPARVRKSGGATVLPSANRTSICESMPLGTEKTPSGLSLYRALTAAATPAAPLLLSWRAKSGKEDLARRTERLGHPSADRPDGRLLWFHAASVGETNAVLPLIAALRENNTDLSILLTTGTVTSADLAASHAQEGVTHQYAPLDAPRFARRFLDHWRPDGAIFAESEIWPNLISETAARGIPLALVNGRVSERSFAKWQRQRQTARALFGSFDLILCQNDSYAERFALLGASAPRPVGNIKVDAPALAVEQTALATLRQSLAGRTVFLAASTHRGEETLIGEVHRALSQATEDLLTIVVPRHPQRGPEIATELGSAGLRVTCRSGGDSVNGTTQVYVADTIGELGLFYTVAPVAFIGGSLVPHGGQNPVEAVKLGTAVLSGPHTANFADAYAALDAKGGCIIVADHNELAERAGFLLRSAATREQMIAAGTTVIGNLSGGLEKTVAALGEWLPRCGHSCRAD